MSIKRGKIFLANLEPTIGTEISKVRPILVISNDINNKVSSTITVIPITSNTSKIYPFEVFIPSGEANLPKDSKAKTNQIRSIDTKRLIKEIGSLPNARIKAVERALKYHLAL